MRRPANSSEPSPRVTSFGLAASGNGSMRSYVGEYRGWLRNNRVFSCAKITPPARPTISFAPVCSGWKWVLISICTRSLPVAARTAASSASACSARPPSTINAPTSPGSASTLQPAPWRSTRPPRSVVVILAPELPLCARAAVNGSHAPTEASPSAGTAAAAALKRRRRESSRLLIPRVRIDGLVNARLAERPDIRPNALRRAEDGPYRILAHLHRRAELAQ